MSPLQSLIAGLFTTISLAVCSFAGAADDRVPRSVGKEPAYTGTPEYALLVFGREAEHRVWIVLDGRTLYVDRNGNGDLTDDGAPVPAREGLPFSGESCEFDVGSLRQGPLRHDCVSVMVSPVAGLRGASVQKLLATSPRARMLRITMMVDNDRLGAGLVRKPYMQLSAGTDAEGVLQLASRAADAPVLHFNGPLRIQSAPWDWENKLTPGLKREIIAVLATPGVGPGSTVLCGYEGLVPGEAYPRLTCAFPSTTPAGEAVLTSFDLKERCCTSQLYAELTAPSEIAPGTIDATLELVGWATESVQSSRFKLPVTAPPALPEEPVSRRLRSTLVHSARTATLWSIQFSPDGRRLLGNSLFEKHVDVWDVDTGRQIVTMDIGSHLPTALLDAVPSPDWTVLYTSTRRRNGTPVEREGKTMMNWEAEGAIHEWDLSTGQRLQSTIVDPPGSVYSLSISKDGSTLFFESDRPGLAEQSIRNAELRLFDAATRTFRTFPGAYVRALEFSPDGERILAMLRKSDWHSTELHILSRETGEVLKRIALDGEQVALTEAHFSPDGRKIVTGSVRYTTPYEYHDPCISVLDATTGDLLYRRQMEAGPWHSTVEWSPDGRFLAVSSRSGSEPRESRFELLNAGDGSNALIRRFRDKEVVRTSAFLKDGSRLALATQVVPQNKLDIDPTEIPQAHIELIDTSNGQTLETLVAPRGSLYSIQFSPDGKTLATSGTGAAYLWDVSHLK